MMMMIKLILTLIIIIAISFFVNPLASASPYGAGKYNANVPYGGETQLSIATSGTVSISVTPTDAGTTASANGTVTVTSTDVVGYKLYIRSLTSTDMATIGGVVIPTSGNGSPGALSTNTWGYSLSGGGSTYVGTTLSDVLILSRTQPYTSGDVTTVTYGVNVTTTKKSGNYSNSVVYTAVPQTN